MAAPESGVSNMSDGVAIQLSPDETLVVFEWLSRFTESGDGTFRDQAEQRVLWDIHAVLESNLVAPFDPQYDRLLAQARSRVRDAEN
jgi:hypothetical protein